MCIRDSHCGIHVEEFSIGFGPRLWSKTKNGTTYSIRLLPLGGYNPVSYTHLSRIRALDSDVLLIFITNMAQYAIKGYAVGALDYVLKPVPYFAFSQQLQKAAGQLVDVYKRQESYSLL